MLERVLLGNLERHFDLTPVDTNQLLHIRKSTEQFHDPYLIFTSPGTVIHEEACSVCDQRVSVRNPCGHVVGQRQACVRVAKCAEPLESFLQLPFKNRLLQ